MPRPRRMNPLWEPWPREIGLGYSLKVGQLRGELSPSKNPATGTVDWCAVLWIGQARGAPIAELRAETHWEAGDEAVALITEGDTST